MDFSNKKVLITGASRGIGRATAIAFAERGADVGVNFVSNSDAANQTLKLLKAGNHKLLQANISDANSAKNLIDEFVKEYGKIDVLVNNAAISEMHEIDKLDYKSWSNAWFEIMNTNLLAAANLCYVAASYMMKAGGGRIVNVSSRGAFRGEPNQSAYGASKAGLNSMTQSMAKALAKYNIYVNAIAPGFTETDMGLSALTEKERISLMNECPLQRMATPEEVAYSIMFLASEGSQYTTGAILDLNGASYLR